MHISLIDALYIYPIKSLPGLAVEKLTLGSLGVEGDRTFVLINAKGRFISQRSHPVLATFHLTDVENYWRVSDENGDFVDVPKLDYSDRAIAVSIWRDEVTAFEVSESISQWFSRQLDESVHLVRFDELSSRQVRQEGIQGHFAFADGYPLLVCNATSLADINIKSPAELSMLRFRPNVVITVPGNQEYNIATLKFEAGGELRLVEPCVRCNIPAINPETAVFEREVHEYLKSAISQGGKPVFGMNAIAHQLANVKLGDRCLFQYPGD